MRNDEVPSGGSSMTIKKAILPLAIIIIALCCGSTLHAQSCIVSVSCGSYSLWYAACLPALPAGAYDCFNSGPFSAQCSLNICPPPCPTCTRGGGPIDLSTGDTTIAETDVSVPGLGGGLTLLRTWHSVPFTSRSTQGMFGIGWNSSYEESIFVDTGNFVTLLRGDGSPWWFRFSTWDSNGNPNFSVGAPANQTAVLAETVLQAQPNWTLTFQNGEIRVYDYFSGKLLSITDRNGNATSLSYDASYRLATVTDAASHQINFSYANPTSYLVTAVTSNFGVSLQYTYDGLGHLMQVTEPDLTTLSFQYDSGFRISSVLDSNGKPLESHTYNSCGQGLTSTRGNIAEQITVQYPLPCAFGVPAAGVYVSQ
jgi:YD repeat-containing protein